MSLETEAKEWLNRRYKDMQLNEYQKKAVEFAIYPHSHSILYPALGLAGEAGEVANKVKKFIRDGYDQENFEVKKIELASEIGDVLWYCAALARDLGFDLSTIAQENYTKLSGRKERGTLGGNGDKR
jgi:NTP pyrophosphatase (non-canonical NTP hydrolase)